MVTSKRDAKPGLRPTGFFMLRTALLPMDVLLAWADGVAATACLDSATLQSAVHEDRTALRHRLKAVIQRPEVREALFLASPSTFADLAKWLTSEDAENARLEQTLARYLQRMAGRSTPFGLFAGCSLGRIGDHTHMEIDALRTYRRYSRLDNDHLDAVLQDLARKPEVRSVLPFRPNSSLYRLAGRWRYVQTSLRGGRRRHNLVALDADAFLETAIERAKDGATVDDLARHIVASDPDGEVSEEEARPYVLELINRQVLVSDLSPIVTGPEAIEDAITQLRPFASLGQVVTTLEDVRERLAAIDRAPVGMDVGAYQAVERTLDGLGVKPDPSRLFQVDMVKPAPDAMLDRTVVDEILKGVDILYRVAPEPGNDPRRRFREAFVERYERREMPLVDVLDEESGIGFDRSQNPAAENAPLLDGVRFPRGTDGGSTAWTARDGYLLWKLAPVLAEGGAILELSDADIDALANRHKPPLADAMSVSAVLGTAPDGGFQIFIKGASGPSGANLLGRFCHADPELHEWVLKQLRAEESLRPDAVFAEIVHLPEGRMGNILARPVLREYEITYLGRSGAPLARQIPISDLLVSIRDDRIVVRSARLGCEVIPRMTNAHAYRQGQGVYRFLCGLQSQAVTGGLGWSWGALENAPFLPRVVHGRLVLQRARWRVDRDTVRSFAEGPIDRQFAAVQAFRAHQRLPRFVVLLDADNELPIDLDNVMSVEAFLQIVKTRAFFALAEMFPVPDAIPTHGPEGRFVHEIMVPFVKEGTNTEERPRVGPGASRHSAETARRSFPPGSDWLYLKWFGGTSSIDSVLTEIVPDLVRLQMDKGAADKWFFVRYPDPQWHLRLRLRGVAPRLRSDTLADAQAGLKPALEDGRVWRVQIDTYEREIERYGGDAGIAASEELFWRDSEAVLEILKVLSGDEGMDARWRLCLCGWDLLLSDLGFTLEQKRLIASQNRAMYARQFRADKTLDRTLGNKFRAVRKSLEELFDPTEHGGHPLAPALAALRSRSAVLQPVAHSLRELENAGRLSASLPSLAGSYLHMHANRLLRSSHRHHEVILYDFLDRLYESQLARARGRGARVVAAG